MANETATTCEVEIAVLEGIADRTRLMAGTNKKLGIREIFDLLGEVSFIPQGRASSESSLEITFDSAATGMLIDVVHGAASSVTNLSFVQSSSAEGMLVELPYTAACYDPNVGTATSLTGTIEAKAGDWILATVTTRSETTFPEGWTVLYQSGAIGSNQRMAMLCRQVSADETVSFTVSQTDNARIYINLMAVGGINGFAYHGDSYETTEATASYIFARPAYDCIIWACTANLWGSTTPYPTWACDEIDSMYRVDLGSGVQARQANFWDDNLNGNRTFVSGSQDGTLAIACVEVLMEV